MVFWFIGFHYITFASFVFLFNKLLFDWFIGFCGLLVYCLFFWFTGILVSLMFCYISLEIQHNQLTNKPIIHETRETRN